MSHPATTRCTHYVLGRRDMPCPVPGCPDGIPQPAVYTVSMDPASAMYLPPDTLKPPGVREERWERSTLAVPGWGRPVDGWRKVDS